MNSRKDGKDHVGFRELVEKGEGVVLGRGGRSEVAEDLEVLETFFSFCYESNKDVLSFSRTCRNVRGRLR